MTMGTNSFFCGFVVSVHLMKKLQKVDFMDLNY